MIPQFPEFKQLERHDQQEIEWHTSHFEPYVDYNFISLWCWDTDRSCTVCRLNDNLVIRYKDWQSADRHVYSFLGTSAVINTTQTLIAFAAGQECLPVLKFIPDVVVTSDDKLRDLYSVTEDCANSDYVYSLRNLVELRGGTYQDVRRKINLFRRRYDVELRVMDLADARVQSMLLALRDHWAEQKQVTDDVEVRNELVAMHRFFELDLARDVVCHGVFEDDGLRAFAITERVDAQYIVLHFWKADRSYQGIYQYLVQQLAAYWLDRGATFLNLMEDGGHPNLARAKRSFRPSLLLKKHIISTKEC